MVGWGQRQRRRQWKRHAAFKVGALGSFVALVIWQIALSWIGSHQILTAPSVLRWSSNFSSDEESMSLLGFLPSQTAWWMLEEQQATAPEKKLLKINEKNVTQVSPKRILPLNVPPILNMTSNALFQINHIYYFNSFVRPDSNQFMKGWLSTQPTIPFVRIEAISGPNVETCRGARCLNDRRVAFTYQYLLTQGGLRQTDRLSLEQKKKKEEYEARNPKSKWRVPNTTTGTAFPAEIPFGDRPIDETPGAAYFNISGTIMVIHEDDIHIQSLEQLQSIISHAMAGGLISSDSWEMIRLACCVRSSLAVEDTDVILSAEDIETNSSWVPHRQTAGVLIWKNSALRKLGNQLFSPERYSNYIAVEHRMARDFYSYSISKCLCSFEETEEVSANVSSASSNLLQTPLRMIDVPMEPKISLERIQQEVAAVTDITRYDGSPKRPTPRIDHIYYSNLEKNHMRKKSMDFWLTNDPLLKASFKRINATIGDPPRDHCVPTKNNPQRCRGLAGIARTLVGIMENENMTGVSLILEDDFVITDSGLRRVEASLALVPSDWDLIRFRFDCLQVDQVDLQWYSPFVANTSTMRIKSDCNATVKGSKCWFCGGAFAMLWRQESINKLRDMWGKVPYDDVDCIVARTPSVRSYCVNIGVGDMFTLDAEKTDIPKVGG